MSFEKVYAIDVSDYVEKKKDLTYLSWAFAWREFMKVYPNATYKILRDENNRCYFGDEKVGYMVYTSVSVGELTHEMWLPVMDNSNKSMKLDSYTYKTKYEDKQVEAMSMFDVNKTIMRCLVKNLAMFGLGLYIYAGEDLPNEEKKDSNEKPALKPAEPKKNYKITKPASKQKMSNNDACPDCQKLVKVLKSKAGKEYWKCENCGLFGFEIKTELEKVSDEYPF